MRRIEHAIQPEPESKGQGMTIVTAEGDHYKGMSASAGKTFTEQDLEAIRADGGLVTELRFVPPRHVN
jgi:hypothetical protein